jgi:hypothetical protein
MLRSIKHLSNIDSPVYLNHQIYMNLSCTTLKACTKASVAEWCLRGEVLSPFQIIAKTFRIPLNDQESNEFTSVSSCRIASQTTPNSLADCWHASGTRVGCWLLAVREHISHLTGLRSYGRAYSTRHCNSVLLQWQHHQLRSPPS